MFVHVSIHRLYYAIEPQKLKLENINRAFNSIFSFLFFFLMAVNGRKIHGERSLLLSANKFSYVIARRRKKKDIRSRKRSAWTLGNARLVKR